MKFQELAVEGAFEIGLEPFSDERGSFARAFCQREFSAHGLPTYFEQMNLSKNPRKFTFRGFHYQLPPYSEGKLIRCVRGRIVDIAIDLRPESFTYGGSVALEVCSDKGNMIYVPPGCAHAFLTLVDDTDVLYMATTSYEPGVERGLRWNDPTLGVTLPERPAVISEKDASWPDFQHKRHKIEWGKNE